MCESIITNESSYGYIINDISYQCCAYSYTFERIFDYYRPVLIFLGTYIGSLEIKNASVKFYVRVFVRFSERNGIYFLAIVYNRVPLSSVVISSNSGSIAFTKASNHVWYASIMNLGSTPAVRQ